MSALDTEGAPSPGLHAVGRVLGGLAFACNHHVGGTSAAPATAPGHLLGRSRPTT